jgi:hypothetical protein
MAAGSPCTVARGHLPREVGRRSKAERQFRFVHVVRATPKGHSGDGAPERGVPRAIELTHAARLDRGEGFVRPNLSPGVAVTGRTDYGARLRRVGEGGLGWSS